MRLMERIERIEKLLSKTITSQEDGAPAVHVLAMLHADNNKSQLPIIRFRS
jgi:hypothetical protein